VSGVYSSKRAIFGTNDVNQSRAFLQDCLGLSSEQIIVVDGVLKTASNSTVYGVTMLATDAMCDELYRPLIAISKFGRRGVHFHEGFHYVNLLLHNKQQRQAVYSEFRRRNPFMSKLSDKQIEEILAERFRKYALRETDNSISWKIKKFFSHVLDFLFQSRKKTLIRRIYTDILNKNYAGMSIDKESMKEFKNAYEEGAFMDVGIPGKDKSKLDNFVHIKDYKTYYDIAESLARSYIAFVLSDTVENTIENSKNSFSRFLEIFEE
jgi:hypothetical protein